VLKIASKQWARILQEAKSFTLIRDWYVIDNGHMADPEILTPQSKLAGTLIVYTFIIAVIILFVVWL
jgi:hypothetical protein